MSRSNRKALAEATANEYDELNARFNSSDVDGRQNFRVTQGAGIHLDAVKHSGKTQEHFGGMRASREDLMKKQAQTAKKRE